MNIVLLCTAALVAAAHAYSQAPTVTSGEATYHGIHRDQIEVFLGIQFGQDTGGQKRFKPPTAYHASGTVDATSPGPACPQIQSMKAAPLLLGNVTDISEDCLRLNVYRPNGTECSDKLPVMVYIHGGSLSVSSKDEPVTQPAGMILESVENKHPVISVQINYRLGLFGFAQSAALKEEGSENAGLRDQRLALEWVQDHIADFGGDPDNVLIHGHSSGGVSVGMQMVAYGASKPALFHKAIAQSSVLEGGITGNYTRNATSSVVEYVKCNSTDFDAPATIECLRGLNMTELLEAQNATSGMSIINIGDIWLPVVDGDFLPEAPSDLIAAGKFYNVTTMIGWCEDDTSLLPPRAESENSSTIREKIASRVLTGFSSTDLDSLFALYPDSDFSPSLFPNGSISFNAVGKKTGRILRDFFMVCQPIFFGRALVAAGNDVYLYDHNQTLLAPIMANNYSRYDRGSIHSSEFAYMFGNLSIYNVSGYPFDPQPADYALLKRQSRSWTSFATFGRPSVGDTTIQGWHKADFDDETFGIQIIGGPYEGFAGKDGSEASGVVLKQQKLRERCGFLTEPGIIKRSLY